MVKKKKREWLPRDEFLKKVRSERKDVGWCAFRAYDEVTPDMVEKFWSAGRYKDGLIPFENVRDGWKPAYETAKKNVAMLDYAMSPNYSVWFDKQGNLDMHVNTGASWSLQNHLCYYADKCGKFELHTSAWSQEDPERVELLYDGEKKQDERDPDESDGKKGEEK